MGPTNRYAIANHHSPKQKSTIVRKVIVADVLHNDVIVQYVTRIKTWRNIKNHKMMARIGAV